MTKTIKTTWEVLTYDVWGNAKGGYEVNDSFRRGSIELEIPVTVNNAGLPSEFTSAYPTDRQLRQALGLRRIQLDLEGDDMTIYVNARRYGYPCGELHCTSHESLSPIRIKEEVTA